MASKTFLNIWSSYAIYYFGKVNLSLIIPILLATQGLTKYDIGFVTSGFFFAYAIGQFLHGQIAERFHPFTYIAVGLIGSAIMNVFLGFYGAFFWALLVFEIMDGSFQSMGWSSCVRGASNISKDPERDSCILGTSYQVGNSIAWLVSAFVIGAFGWQYGFWVAAIIMFIRGITLWASKPKMDIEPNKIRTQVKFTLTTPIILAGLSLCFLNMVRYGVITWIPTYLFEVQSQDIFMVGLKVCLIPIFGVVGTLAYNKLKVSRELLTSVFLLFLGILFIVFPSSTDMFTVALLLISGFLVYGPHVFLVSTIPSRFVDKKVVSAASGFIDGMGYVGTVIVGISVPFLIDIGGGSWNLVFWFWSALAFIIMFISIGIYFFDGKLKETNLNGNTKVKSRVP